MRRNMKITLHKRDKATIYIGGNPAKGTVPEVTIEMISPQILLDTNSNIIVIDETK
jgi:hypothetical protein